MHMCMYIHIHTCKYMYRYVQTTSTWNIGESGAHRLFAALFGVCGGGRLETSCKAPGWRAQRDVDFSDPARATERAARDQLFSKLEPLRPYFLRVLGGLGLES